MRGCHDCAYAAEIAKGKFADTEWKDLPCAECDVSLGANTHAEFELEPDNGDGDCHAPEVREDELLPMSVMREVVVGLLTLRPEVRDVVAWRYAGMRYTDIAGIQGVSPSCVELRHRRAMKAWPVLKALFPEKTAKHERRIEHGENAD